MPLRASQKVFSYSNKLQFRSVRDPGRWQDQRMVIAHTIRHKVCAVHMSACTTFSAPLCSRRAGRDRTARRRKIRPGRASDWRRPSRPASVLQRALDLGVGGREGDAERLQGCAIEIRPVRLARDVRIGGRVRNLTPADHLRIEPQRMALPREGRRLGEGDEEVLGRGGCRRRPRRDRRTSRAASTSAGRAMIRLAGQDLRQLGAIAGLARTIAPRGTGRAAGRQALRVASDAQLALTLSTFSGLDRQIAALTVTIWPSPAAPRPCSRARRRSSHRWCRWPARRPSAAAAR